MSIPGSAKKENHKEGLVKEQPAKTTELKTEGPLSEKDEVKKAEDETNKPLKK